MAPESKAASITCPSCGRVSYNLTDIAQRFCAVCGFHNDILTGWTIYDHPRDYPDCFVARKWLAQRGGVVATTEMFTADTLDELRALLPPGLTCLARLPGDEPQIVEVWI
jgi:hypothetical protein